MESRVDIILNQVEKLFSKYFPKEMARQKHLLELQKLRKKLELK